MVEHGKASYRHSFVTRITHATFTLSFLGLAFSGAQMALHAHWLPSSPALHRYFGLGMIGSGIVYFAGAALNGDFSRLIFTADDLRALWPMTAYYLRLQSTPPPYEA